MSWGNAWLRPKMTPREREGRKTRSRSVSRPRRAEGGGLSEGVTGWRSERSPSAAPTRAQTGGVLPARSTQDSSDRFPRAGLGSRNFVWGTELGSGREGGREAEGGGPSAKPRPRPQVRPAGGGGNFRSALGKRGAGA